MLRFGEMLNRNYADSHKPLKPKEGSKFNLKQKREKMQVEDKCKISNSSNLELILVKHSCTTPEKT